MSRLLACLLLVGVCGLPTVEAQTTGKNSKPAPIGKPALTSGGPKDYSSKNFLLHTDLSEDDAKELLVRLENMLKLISTYWGRPNRQVIECYVVKNLANWPEGSLDPRGLQSIQAQAGVTSTRKLQSSTGAFLAKSIVYAVADRGTPQHEAVHAYCGQSFGTTGPTWYSEGMAEMGQYWKENDASVNCHPGVVEFIRTTEPKSLNSIVNGNEMTGDSWQNYAWRWALCHLLATNPNYSPKFRPLGIGMLAGQKVSFESVYGPSAKEISFEYLFFLKHFDIGFRADLCAWDWKMKFKHLAGPTPQSVKIKAKGGWQPTGCSLKAGTTYEYLADGQWNFSKDADEVTADGGPDGRGKLIGVLFNPEGYELGASFDLGAAGEWTPDTDGQLFVRCQEPWQEINDENSGTITLKLKLKGKGASLGNSRGK